MIKSLIVLSVLAAAFGQKYEYMNNIVDFDDSPYQRISLPYVYRDDSETRVQKVYRKPIKNAILVNNEYMEVERPANPSESPEVKTSLSSIKTSLINTICAVAIKFLGVLKAALKLMILKIPALIFGAIVMIGFCKITSVCTKISSIQSLSDAQEEFSLFITPERLDMASDFIQEAIRRYRSIQAN